MIINIIQKYNMSTSTGNTSSIDGCGNCKLCKPSQQYQTLTAQNFLKVEESKINNRPKSFYVITNGLIFGNLDSIPFDSLVDPGAYTCFNCWHSGHSYVECNQPKLQCFCQNCGRKDVTMNDCPRCASAYLEFAMQKMEICCQGSDDGYYREATQEQEYEVFLNHFGDVEEIPFEIDVDVPAENCHKCLNPRHPDKQFCVNARSGDYCFNCGRSGVRVYNCPRCRNAYPIYVERRDEAFGRDTTTATKVKNRPEICEADDKSSNSSIPSTELVEKRSTRAPASGPFNLYVKALRDIVIQSMDDIKKPKPPVEHRMKDTKTSKTSVKQCMEMTELAYSIDGSKSTTSSGIVEEYLSDEEDEDLDQIIVDEDEKPQLDEPPSEGIREFMNLMDAVKHLSIDAQSSVALEFVRKRQVLMNEKKEKQNCCYNVN